MSTIMLSAHYPLHPLTVPLGDMPLVLREELVKTYIDAERDWKSIIH